MLVMCVFVVTINDKRFKFVCQFIIIIIGLIIYCLKKISCVVFIPFTHHSIINLLSWGLLN